MAVRWQAPDDFHAGGKWVRRAGRKRRVANGHERSPQQFCRRKQAGEAHGLAAPRARVGAPTRRVIHFIIDSAKFLGQKQTVTKRPHRNWIGLASALSVDLTEEDIAEAR